MRGSKGDVQLYVLLLQPKDDVTNSNSSFWLPFMLIRSWENELELNTVYLSLL